MGEYADMIVDSMIDGWRGSGRPKNGDFRERKKCRRCGKRGLVWAYTSHSGWRLHEKREQRFAGRAVWVDVLHECLDPEAAVAGL